MKQYRIIFLLVAFVGLSALAFWLLSSDSEELAQGEEEQIQLKISSEKKPDKIVLVNDNVKKTIQQIDGNWYLNQKARIKPELKEALHVILQQIQVKRPVSGKQKSYLLAQFDSAATLVEVFEDDQLLQSLEVWGNRIEKITYARIPGSDKIYIVEIPGYSTYIADIFFFSEEQWRNNSLFESTWRSLKTLQVQFPGKATDDFTIVSDELLFHVAEVEQTDTVALLDYLETFSSVKIEQFLPHHAKNVDSLFNTQAAMIVHIDDFDTAKTNTIYFYKPNNNTNNNNNDILVLGKRREIGVISEEAYNQIEIPVSSFERNDNN